MCQRVVCLPQTPLHLLRLGSTGVSRTPPVSTYGRAASASRQCSPRSSSPARRLALSASRVPVQLARRLPRLVYRPDSFDWLHTEPGERWSYSIDPHSPLQLALTADIRRSYAPYSRKAAVGKTRIRNCQTKLYRLFKRCSPRHWGDEYAFCYRSETELSFAAWICFSSCDGGIVTCKGVHV
jgi:hypothetical protein